MNTTVSMAFWHFGYRPVCRQFTFYSAMNFADTDKRRCAEEDKGCRDNERILKMIVAG